MQRPRASLRRRSPNNSNTRSAFGSRTRYAPRRRRSFLATISPPPTTGMPSSSSRRASIASTSRYRTAIFDFANTISSVEEYPRLIREAISRHAAFRRSSKPFKKALRVSSSPIPMARIRPRRAYRDFAASANIPEVLALVRCLRRGLDVLQLRGDLVDLLRLRVHAAHAVSAEGEDAPHAEFLKLLQDEIAQLVLPFRREPLIVPCEEDQVRPVVPLDVVHLVVHELDLAVVLDEDLRREVLREDLRELDALQLVLQVLGRELANVPDAGQPFDEDRVFELRMVEVPDHDVVHGVSSLQFMGPLKFAPVLAVAVLRGVSGRHRIPGGTAARRTDVLQSVPTAGPALLQDGSHRLNPSDGTSPRRLSRSAP